MSYLRRKLIHGNWYLYLVHSVRHGKHVNQIIDEYLGPDRPKRIDETTERYYARLREKLSK